MHLNHYFLAQLASELKEKLKDAWLLECFTQNKDEVLFAFAKQGEDFYVKCELSPSFQSLTFWPDFRRAKSNSADLFPKAMELQVQDVVVTTNDRSFSVKLEKDCELLFKMHGNRANVVLFQSDMGVDQFHKSYPDLEHMPSFFAKERDFNMATLQSSGFDMATFLPALGKDALRWLDENGFQTASDDDKVELVCQMLELLQHPSAFYIVDKGGQAKLTFFQPKEAPLAVCHSAIEVANKFQRFHFTHQYHEKQQDSQEKLVQEKRQKLLKFIADTEKKLEYFAQAKVWEQTADVLMAHLNHIEAGVETVRLFDFYQNKEVDIKLKKELSPQKNAQSYYQKAKNAAIETGHVLKTLEAKKHDLVELDKKLQELSETEGELSHKKQKTKKVTEEVLPYKKFEFDGFEIRVGKNAQKNDELTLKYAAKNDLWLHARGMAGSHVVLKMQAGKPFPAKVIEKAAAIAAWYSKGKTDSLCPVIVTERKYVRKSKGMAPGQVTVDKEKVIMVEPSIL
jgi:hypothetical protein